MLSNSIASSRKLFERSGGVIPEEAARQQVQCILPVIHDALSQATLQISDIDAIAVTRGPGLLGSLIVGTTAARTIAYLWNKPLIGVHHTLGHLSSTFLSPTQVPEFPILTLSVSGGHTDLWYRTSHVTGNLIGSTRDDAAGEAFDKGAAMLGLPYPGGPSLSKQAANGDTTSFPFPLPLQGDGGFDYSFAGLKTALRYTIRDTGEEEIQSRLSDVCASYEYAICTHLLDRVKNALVAYPDAKELHIVGGVSANSRLRTMAKELSDTLFVRTPTEIQFCTDNAAMIASAAYFLYTEHPRVALEHFETSASLPLTLQLQ